MLIVRPAEESDVDQLYDLIQESAYGLTTLKISKQQLLDRVESSTFSFKMKSGKPAGQPYVFVMEDLSVRKRGRHLCDLFKDGWLRTVLFLQNQRVDS